MIVPFPAGAQTDSLGRIMAERMRASLGQHIIIENVGGANGSIGTVAFAHARQGATPGSGDAPGVVTSFQRARDFVNALRPGSGIKTACAPLAEEMKQDVLGLLGKLATGVLTIPALLPLIP
jgi:hypothetical protein